jgi:hypothetical protein
MIVAAYDRIRKGKPLVEADRSLSHSANCAAAVERLKAIGHGRATRSISL